MFVLTCIFAALFAIVCFIILMMVVIKSLKKQ